MEDKSWAEGLTEKEFTGEFVRRHPFADTVPNMNEWLERDSVGERAIDPFNPELLEPEEVSVHKAIMKKTNQTYDKYGVIAQKDGTFKCVGCGRESKARIGIVSHAKKCNDYIEGYLLNGEKNVSSAS